MQFAADKASWCQRNRRDYLPHMTHAATMKSGIVIDVMKLVMHRIVKSNG